MKKIIFRVLLLVLVMLGLIIGYYQLMRLYASRKHADTTQSSDQLLEMQERDGKVDVSGEVVIQDNRYYLKIDDRSLIDLNSQQLSFSIYLGKTVEVSGTLVDGQIQVTKIQELN